MKEFTRCLFSFLLTAFFFISCGKVAPGSFWETYQPKILRQNISDQGPRGGTRAMHWQTNVPNTFKPSDIIDFASQNGWKLVDSIDNSPGSSANWDSKTMLRWIITTSKTYIFKTGWMRFEPGTDSSIETNGFLVVKSDGTEMCVYHYWGE